MMTTEQNELMTRGGPGTAAGKLLQMYWQPAALVDELQGPRPVKAVRLLGENLVLFREARGECALIQRHCPHRSADLAYGRLEARGLRCLFHGWLFDARGQCLEMPAEPAGSTLCREVRARTYPVIEPNWLQALEVGTDPAHASFLHRFFEDEDPSASYGQQFRAAPADSDMPMTRLLREFERPRIDVERTEFGLRIFALRELNEGSTHIRVTNLLFPQAFTIPLSSEMTITQWHVPVDDESCYWYAIFTSFGQPVNKTEMRNQRLALYELPDYVPRINRSNGYGFNPAEQQSRTYSGMGCDINVHDQRAVESQGRIHDRTREYLASTDKAIVAYRRLLLRAIEQAGRGERPLMVLDETEAQQMRGPVAVDGIGPSDAWRDYWRENDRRRRHGSPWAARLPAP